MERYKTSKEIDEEYTKKYERGEIGMFDGPFPTPNGNDNHDSLFYYGLESNNYVALDAETYALRGTELDPYDRKNTFAISITDINENSKTFIYYEEEKCTEWVKKNVIPNMTVDAENTILCNSYEEMMILAKEELIQKYPNHDILVHCGSPVEYNVLREMDRVSPEIERVYDRNVIDMGDMKYFKNNEIKSIGGSVDETLKDLNIEHYGNNHDPEADNINAIRALKAIQEQNTKHLEKLNVNKENVDKISDLEVGLYVLNQVKIAEKKIEEKRSFDNNTYVCNNFDEGKFFKDGYQVTFSRPLNYGSIEQNHDNKNFTTEEYGQLIKYCLNTYENDNEIYIGVYNKCPEISFHYKNEDDAMKIAREFNQESIYDYARSLSEIGYEETRNIDHEKDLKIDILLTEDKLIQIDYQRDIDERKIDPNTKYNEYYVEKAGEDKLKEIYEFYERIDDRRG